jgi:hypothetical protein
MNIIRTQYYINNDRQFVCLCSVLPEVYSGGKRYKNNVYIYISYDIKRDDVVWWLVVVVGLWVLVTQPLLCVCAPLCRTWWWHCRWQFQKICCSQNVFDMSRQVQMQLNERHGYWYMVNICVLTVEYTHKVATHFNLSKSCMTQIVCSNTHSESQLF